MDSKVHISLGNSINYVMRSVWNSQKIIFLFFVLQVLSFGIIDYVWVFAGKNIITYLQISDGRSTKLIVGNIICASVIELILAIIKEVSEKQIDVKTIPIRFNYIIKNMEKTFSMKYELLENPNILDLRRKSFKAIENPEDGISGIVKGIGRICSYLIVSIIAVILVIEKNFMIAIIMIFTSFIRVVAWNNMAKYEKKEVYDKLVKINRKSYYFDSIIRRYEYAKDIRLYNIENFLLEKQKEIHRKIIEKNGLVVGKWGKVWIFDCLITFIQQIIIYVWLISLIIAKKVEIADFVLYLGVILNFISSFDMFLNELVKLINDSRYVADYQKFVEYDEESERNKQGEELYRELLKTETDVKKKCGENVEYCIEFRHVFFRYPKQEEYILKDINIKFEGKKRTAIVGHNGAGKSTIIKLLCRLYSPTKGEILLNGININTFSIDYYYDIIAPIFQEIQCFAMDIGENIAFREYPEYDKSKIMDCMIKVGMKDKLASLSEGIRTPLLKSIEKTGIDLSGGEKQKLAFARALYKNSPIVVLDEPTSALDPIAEEKSYREIDKYFQEKTVVYISHRLSSTRFCHNIYVIEEGKVVESGTHNELMKLDEKYAKLYKLQSKYYEECNDVR